MSDLDLQYFILFYLIMIRMKFTLVRIKFFTNLSSPSAPNWFLRVTILQSFLKTRAHEVNNF